MSFSQDVKKELMQSLPENYCCQRSMLYGMCLFGKSFSPSGVGLQTENENIAQLYTSLMKKHCRVNCAVKTSPKGRSYSVNIKSRSDCDKILASFGHSDGGSLKINHSNFDCDGCMNAFLAGVFLACGTVSAPQRDYHMEFAVPYLNLSRSFVTFLGELELSPKSSVRKGYNIIYFKGSSGIEDCLYLMGASSSMFEMMNIEIVKDFRNKANRAANCETANIEKTVKASMSQIAAVEKIARLKGLEYLSSELRDIAVLRRDNPELSLSELAKLSGLSRSGVNHRLKKIIETAANLK